jgi:H+/Cl- antiporter ClcA
VAGALFGVKLLAIGQLRYAAVVPSFVAVIVGYQVSTAFGTTYFHYAINFLPMFSELLFFKVVLGGIAFGLVSFLFIELLILMERLSDRIHWWVPLKGLLGGGLLLITLLRGERYLGQGLTTVESVLNGKSVGTGYDPFI